MEEYWTAERCTAYASPIDTMRYILGMTDEEIAEAMSSEQQAS